MGYTMLVMKFGGTSVGSAERMHNLVPLILSDEPRLVVLSAMSGTTNKLVEIANAFLSKEDAKAKELVAALEKNYSGVVNQLYKTESARNKAEGMLKLHFDVLRAFSGDSFTVKDEKTVLAQGELLSTALFQYFLEESGVDSALLPALEFMRIDENEEPDLAYIETNVNRILANYPGKKIFITQGYICRNAFGEIDNLKRGGSDYTASLLGAALYSPEIQIWTDIDGMHNNDPRVVDKTYPIAELSFDEAAELAYFGAKILHPTCVLPAKQRNIPVRLLNTMQPKAKGTLITSKASGEGVKAIAAKEGIVAINIKSGRMLLAYGFLRSVFEVFERYKTPIDMITTSEVAVSLTIDNDKYLDEILKELKQYATVQVDRDQAIICIVGNLPGSRPGYAHRIMESLKDIPIRMISYGGSDHNVSILIDGKLKKNALIALNKGLFEKTGINVHA